MGLYLDEVLEDEELQVIITNTSNGSGQEAWSGIMAAPVSFSSSAEFSAEGYGILERLDSMYKGATKFAGLLPNEAIRQKAKDAQDTSILLHDMTVKSWSGSADPQINVSFAMSNHPGMPDAFRQYYNLHSTLFPDTNLERNESSTSSVGASLVAPYGHKSLGNVSENVRSEGLWSLDIGTWFKAKELLLTNVTLESSLTLDESQARPAPIYAAVTCTFTTERAALASKVRSWLVDNNQ